MVNVEKLRGTLKENGVSIDRAAKVMGIDTATFYRRVNRNGETFTVREIDELARLLNMSGEMLQSIFFDRDVAEMQEGEPSYDA